MNQNPHPMKKLIFLPLLLLFSVATIAQDSKITTGLVAYNQQDYDKAVEALEQGLKDESQVKDKNLPKGYYYYGKALIGQLQKAAMSKDAALIEKYQDNMLKAHTAFKNAQKKDDGKWGDKVQAELKNLYNSFLSTGLTVLNKANTLSGPQQQKAYNEVKQYLEICIDIDNTNYLSYDLLGQTELGLKDSTNAIKSFNKAAQAFVTNPPKNPDLLVAYVYYRIGLLERYMNNDLDKALKAIEQGKTVVDKEWERLQGVKSNYTESNWQSLTEQYQNATQDLSRFELDILLNSPEKMGEAITKFEKAVQEEPNNYLIRVAYAQLLEQVDAEKAIVQYRKSIEIDPNNYMAYFNLGAIYNNIAAEYYKQANAMDLAESQPLQDKAEEYMELAYPVFQKVLEIEPSEVSTLRALSQIAITLEKLDDYKKYKAQLKELGY